MSLKDIWVDIQKGDDADPALINDIARAVIEDEKKIFTNQSDILFMKNISIPAIEQNISDLQDETSLNKNNIDVNTAEIEKNKRETSQIFSNALKESKKSKSVLVDNISPIEHIVKVKASGKNLFGLAGRVERSMGGTFSPSNRNFTGSGIYYSVSGGNNYNDLLSRGEVISDKYSFDKTNNTLTVTSTSVNYGLAIDIAVKPSTPYTISGSFSVGSFFFISQYDKDGNFINGTQKKNGTITTEPNTAWVLLILMPAKVEGVTYETVTGTNIQFEEGSVATEYEAYIDPTTIQIQVYDAKNNMIVDEFLNRAGVLELSSSILMPSATITTVEKLYNVEVEYNRDINTLDIGSSGSVQGDYIPTPTTAQVGDILKVKAIDENGKPVEWECANESGGGSGGGSAEWELISSGELTEEVSSLKLDGFDCSKISLKLAVVATATNSGDSYLRIRTNTNTAANGGTNDKLNRVFRTTASEPILAQIDIDATPTTLKGQLWCSSGVESLYSNAKQSNSITGLYLTPVTSGCVYGVGSTYELWGVRN